MSEGRPRSRFGFVGAVKRKQLPPLSHLHGGPTMDCRQALVLILSLLSGSVGCSHLPSSPTASADASKEQDKPKRQPKPATCVALAQLREREAEEPNRQAPDRDRCRDEARQESQQALTIDPRYLPALQGLAHYYDANGDHDRAVATYEKAVQLYPKGAGVWSRLGMKHRPHDVRGR